MPTLTMEEIVNMLKHYKGDHEHFKKISEEIGSVTVKRLLLLIDMATQGTDTIDYERFMQCYDECGKDEF